MDQRHKPVIKYSMVHNSGQNGQDFLRFIKLFRFALKRH